MMNRERWMTNESCRSATAACGAVRARGRSSRKRHGHLMCFLWGAALALSGLRSASAVAADVRGLLLDAQKQYEQSHYEQALKKYREALDAGGNDASIDYNIALCHLNLGDAEKAIQLFEGVAGRSDARPALRRDASYNIGVIRATAARDRLKALLAPATQPAEPKRADAPENIETLRSIADDFLRAIAGFRRSQDIEPGPDAEQNIRAARIMRRDVLGLLRRALEEKEKKSILDDPREYLDGIILDQARQVSLSRHALQARTATRPAEDSAEARALRRSALRLQRKTMERTDTFAAQLAQFREAADKPGAPATQPAAETPREQLYHAVAKAMQPAIASQRDACGHFLDGGIDNAYKAQHKALDAMRQAAALFPIEPERALVRWGVEQAVLRELVGTIKSSADWLRDPLLENTAVPAGAKWDLADTAIHDAQKQIGDGLGRLARQCRLVATATQPAAPGPPSRQEDPALDPDLNGKLADILDTAAAPSAECLTAIAEGNALRTVAAQTKIAETIEAALNLFPKSVEQRLAELIVRQLRLNDEVKGEAGEAAPAAGGATEAIANTVRDLTARLKSLVLRRKPAEIARALGDRQRNIRKDTVAVNEEIRKYVTAASSTQPAPGTDPQAKVQAYIEAGKHVDMADSEMAAAAEGLDKAVIQKSLRILKSDGPVQKAQAAALDELHKALAALRPPQTQPRPQDPQEQKDRQQKQDEPQARQDFRRAVDRQDREREEAMRRLHQVRPRTAVKDW